MLGPYFRSSVGLGPRSLTFHYQDWTETGLDRTGTSLGLANSKTVSYLSHWTGRTEPAEIGTAGTEADRMQVETDRTEAEIGTAGAKADRLQVEIDRTEDTDTGVAGAETDRSQVETGRTEAEIESDKFAVLLQSRNLFVQPTTYSGNQTLWRWGAIRSLALTLVRWRILIPCDIRPIEIRDYQDIETVALAGSWLQPAHKSW